MPGYNEVKKIRKNLDNIAKCWQLMKERFYDLVSIREELWNLYGKQGLEEMKVCEENMEIMELSKIFDLISKHCVQEVIIENDNSFKKLQRHKGKDYKST